MPQNRFVHASLVDLHFNELQPFAFLRIGTEIPVDWEALGPDGQVTCRQLDFVLTDERVRIDGEPLAIRCTFHSLVKDGGLRGGYHFYLLALQPHEDKKSVSYATMLTQIVADAAANHRHWCDDVSEIRISWRYAPEEVIVVSNDAFQLELADGPVIPARPQRASVIGRLRTA